MRRLLTLALTAAALAAGGPAAADPQCYGVVAANNEAGVCTEYVCVDICAPEYHVDPYCDVDTNPPSILLEALCAGIDRTYVVVP